MSGRPFLHIATLQDWATGARTGTYGARLDGPYLHLSTPEQVALPANDLFAGRSDLWLLVIDEARLPVPVRWEEGDPPSSDGTQFPHLYARLPVAAVIAVVPYEPGPDGTFVAPVGLPAADDLLARARALERYLALARATSVISLEPGFAVQHRDYPASYDHNRVVLPRLTTPTEAEDLCARGLAGLDHWQVTADGPADAAILTAFEAAGWEIATHAVMVATGSPDARTAEGSAVEEVGLDDLAQWRRDDWREVLAGMSDEVIEQLIDREVLTDQVARVIHLAVRDSSGRPVARADLRVVGATAQIEDVATHPASRGKGMATALMRTALRRADELGCDIVVLAADQDDWPLRFYERLGFQAIAAGHVLDRAPTPITRKGSATPADWRPATA